MPSTDAITPDSPNVRGLASEGTLKQRCEAATKAEFRRLYAEASAIATPVLFERRTRQIEFQRGHFRCAQSVGHLEPDCFDAFTDDLDSVVRHLFTKAKGPIRNLDGWLNSRLNAATVDGHRHRRGVRGALQRPRLPGWLKKALNDDPWLGALAIEMLVWVGVPATVGASLWPLDAWAERRAAITGDRVGADAAVRTDIETVLTAMRRKPHWYDMYVLRPLGHKPAPLAGPVDPGREWRYLALTARHEQDDALLLELAGQAIEEISARLRRGEDTRSVVAEVLTVVFVGGSAAERMDLMPGDGSDEGEMVARLVADPRSLDRIVEAVLALLPGG